MQIFESVEDIWIIWAISFVTLLVWFRYSAKGLSAESFRRFFKNQSGASYALPYVLTFPIYLLLMAVLLQASLILLCKLGTISAANAAARTVTVWQSAYSSDQESAKGFAQFKAKRAAVMAMAPFANSSQRDFDKLFPLFPGQFGDIFSGEILDIDSTAVNLLVNVDQYVYASAYSRMLTEANSRDSASTHEIIKAPKGGVNAGYIRRKYLYAAAATWVEFPDEIVAWNDDLKVTVKYRMAFHIPATAKVFGGSVPLFNRFFNSNVNTRDIESSVTIASEAAETPEKTVGIPYDPSLFRSLITADQSGEVRTERGR